MKVVVTGGAGFIGSHLVDVLIARGDMVHVVDTCKNRRVDRENPQASYFTCVDVRDAIALAQVMYGAEVVFHTAALPRVQYSIEHPQETNDVNVGGTLNVLEAARKAGVKRVIYSSSSSVYGMSEKLPLSEKGPTNPVSPYGVQKLMGEMLCQTWSRTYALQTVCLRYFNVYGPRLDPEGDYALVIGIFLRQLREGKPLTITGDGTQTRDFTHVSDVVRANLLAATSQNVGGGEVINIGAGRSVSINELASMFGGSREYITPRLEPHDSLADTSKAKRLLDWNPSIPIETGIAELKRLYL